MKAQLKCSNCGAEISNLNFHGDGSSGYVYSLYALRLPFPIIMNHTILKDKNNFRTDLIIKDTEKRYTNGN
jgi:hypothetical protein